MGSVDVMPLSTSAYLADTPHLSLPHHGAYMLILMAMWRANGWIADDEHVFANICKISVKKWRGLAPILRPLLLSKDGKVSQKRLLREFEKARDVSAKNSANGARGGAAKALKNKDSGVATATVSPTGSPAGRQPGTSGSYSSSSDSDSKAGEGKKNSSRGTALPGDWQPTASHVEYGAGQGLTAEEVAKAGEDMRLWAAANANRAVGRKADWDATFKGWLRREGDRKKTRQLRGGFDGAARGGGAQPAGKTRGEGFAAFAARRARDAGEGGS